MIIRQEIPSDYKTVYQLIKHAFENEELSDHKEQELVERLRQSDAFITELSLVAEEDNQILGHILLTKIKIKGNHEETESLALAPVSVLPKHQGRGIGGELIQKAHQIAENLGYQSIVLLGHAQYYPRFGYTEAHAFGISLPFDVPKENAMVLELVKDGLKGVSGVVEYSKAFMG